MDPLSGIASVLSVADVAVRSCERLRDLISDLRDAPQSVQRLRGTIQNTESILRSVWLFLSEFNSSTLATVYHEVLPEAVERSLEGIRDDLNLLQKILAPDDSSGDMWKRIGHVRRKKAAEEIARRLNSQQSTLSLALQSAAERRGIKLHGHVLDQRKEILGVQEKLTNALLDAGKTNVALLEGISNMQKDGHGIQTSLSTAIGGISSSVLDSQVETSAQLKQLHSMLSDRLDQGCTQIDGSIKAITKNALMPIVRAELRRIVLPAVNHNKSHFDLHMERTRHAIDQMAQSLGHILKDRPTVDRHPRPRSPVRTVPEEEVRHSQGLYEHEIQSLYEFQPSTDLGEQLDTFSRTWTYMLSIGFLCVRVYTSRTRSKDGAQSRAFGRNTSAWSEEVYNLYISFQPARILSKGVSLTTGSRRDQRGHYFRCPEISTFAIIPLSSEIFRLVASGDIKGLQTLFAKKLASPTDRDLGGRTALHLAALYGNFDVCEVLVNEGAEPGVTDKLGLDCLEIMHRYIFAPIPYREAASHIMTSKCAITRLFLRNGCDIHEIYQKKFHETPFALYYGPRSLQGWSEEPILQNKSHYCRIWLQFLSDQSINVDYGATDNNMSPRSTTTLHYFIGSQTRELDMKNRRNTEVIFMLCAVGANVSARMPDSGAQPMHLVGAIPYSPENALYIGAQFEILLQFGADPCARDGYSRSVTEIACSSGWKEQWFQALRKCNKAQLVLEQFKAERAGRTEAPFDNAMRTGVDVTDLSKSSVRGLSKRVVALGDRLDD